MDAWLGGWGWGRRWEEGWGLVFIYLCGLGDALAEDFDLYVPEGRVECHGHGGGPVPGAFAAG